MNVENEVKGNSPFSLGAWTDQASPERYPGFGGGYAEASAPAGALDTPDLLSHHHCHEDVSSCRFHQRLPESFERMANSWCNFVVTCTNPHALLLQSGNQ